MKKTIGITLLLLFVFMSVCGARGTRLEAALEKSQVTLGNPVYLNVVFHGAQNATRPDMPEIEGLRIKYVGPSTQVFVNNGRVDESITHAYLVVPLKEGTFKIGPFFVDHRGQTYSAPAVRLSVSGGRGGTIPGIGQIGSNVPSASSGQPSAQSHPSAPSQNTEAIKAYTGDRVFLVASIPRREVYVNEIVPLTVKLYVDNLGLKEIEYPNFSFEGFSVEQWSEPDKRQERHDGKDYNVLVFRRNLFGIKEGRYTIGPASLGCKAVVPKTSTRRRSSMFGRSVFSDDFFSGIFEKYETYPMKLESGTIEIIVLPFPKKGRPSDFQGAVGDYAMEVRVEPRDVKVGDPITVRTVITGTGNMDTVTAPKVGATDDLKTYEPQASKKENRKIYEQVLIPKTKNVKEIPALSFSFFNPSTGEYKTVTDGPVAVKVTERPESEKMVKVVSMGGGEKMLYPQEKLGRDIIYVKENIGTLRSSGRYVHREPLFWGAQSIPLILFLILLGVHHRKEKMRTDKKYARFLLAPGKARKGIKKAQHYLAKDNLAGFYDSIFKTYQEYLGNKFNLPIGSVTASAVENKLRPVDCKEGMLEMIREVFSECEMARYAPSQMGGSEAEGTLEKVRKVIDYLEKVRL